MSASDIYSTSAVKHALAIMDKERHNFMQLFDDIKGFDIHCNLHLAIASISSALDTGML